MSLLRSAGAGAFLVLGPLCLLYALGAGGLRGFVAGMVGVLLLGAAALQIIRIHIGDRHNDSG